LLSHLKIEFIFSSIFQTRIHTRFILFRNYLLISGTVKMNNTLSNQQRNISHMSKKRYHYKYIKKYMINIYQKKIRLCVYNSLVGVNVTVEHTHEGGKGSIVAMNYNEPSHCVNDSPRYSSRRRRCCCCCTAYASRPIKGSLRLSLRWKEEFEPPRREVNNHGRSRGALGCPGAPTKEGTQTGSTANYESSKYHTDVSKAR